METHSLSAKFPVTLLLIELAETLRVKDSFVTLTWVPREENDLADALTNLNFDAFDMNLREAVSEEDMGWLVLDELMENSRVLSEEIKAHKEMKRAENRKKKHKVHNFFGNWAS